jgi:hypothetical protein
MHEYGFPHSMLTTLFSPLLPDRVDELLEKQIGKNYVIFFHARNGIYNIMLYLNKKYGSSRIHMPSGICGVVPLVSEKADYKIIYYKGIPKNVKETDIVLSTDGRRRPQKGVFYIQDSAKTSILPIKGFDFTIYSFNEDKPISAGYGGVALVNNPKFLDFLKVSNSLKPPSFSDEFNSYTMSIRWKIRSYKIVRDVGRMVLQMLKGKQGALGKFNPNGKFINLDRTMPKVSRRLASTHLVLR